MKKNKSEINAFSVIRLKWVIALSHLTEAGKDFLEFLRIMFEIVKDIYSAVKQKGRKNENIKKS